MTDTRIIDIKTGRPLEREVMTPDEEWRHNIKIACNAYYEAITHLNRATKHLDRRLKMLERPWYKKLFSRKRRRHDD